MTICAALIEEFGEPPSVGEIDEPEPTAGEVVVELLAAALNPVDVAIASGGFYGGHPPLPYVPLIEGVGIVRSGARTGEHVYVSGGGLGVARNGAAAEVFTSPADALVGISEDDDPSLAVALGTAGLAGWLPLQWRAELQPDETVLVLGATGTAGTIAVQAARLLGAGRVVAAGRNPERLRALEHMADVVVNLDETEGLGRRLAEACGDGGADVIYDPLWGEPLAAALTAAAAGARVAHVGASAGGQATLDSAAVRGKQVEILGYSNFVVPRDASINAFQRMLKHARAGELQLDVHEFPLAGAAKAWRGFTAAGGKYVLVP